MPDTDARHISVPEVARMQPVVDPLVRKLERLGPLGDEERQELDAVVMGARPVKAGQDFLREGQHSQHCLLLLDGFACRYKRLDSGRRQIVAFLLPGDICDLASLLLPQADHSVAALTPARVAAVPHATVLGWMRQHEALGHALWRDVLVEASVFREWVLNVGCRTPLQRVAHLLCELIARMHMAGLVTGDTYDLPISHAELADATGLATVLVNRALQELVVGGLIELDGRTLVVNRWDSLTQAAGFDPRYLHQLAAAA